ncbi:MAG: hypothetical protein ACK55Z_02740, partial [bacterium]
MPQPRDCVSHCPRAPVPVFAGWSTPPGRQREDIGPVSDREERGRKECDGGRERERRRCSRGGCGQGRGTTEGGVAGGLMGLVEFGGRCSRGVSKAHFYCRLQCQH